MRDREAFRSMNARFYVNTGGGEEMALEINKETCVLYICFKFLCVGYVLTIHLLQVKFE